MFFALATGVQFGPGLRFYRSGGPAVARGAPDMNSLVMLGSSAAWAYSVAALFFAARLPAGTANVYFEASAVIISLVLAGRYLEARARGRAGDEVVGGTINGSGAFSLRATRVGADTVLARIVRMVEQAQATKLPIQALVDRVTLVFVPVVIGLATLTFAAWLLFAPPPALGLAVVNAVAVLIIACPCAMGLATPTSIMVGTGKAAELGLLFRRGDALQTLRDADTFVLDKTGTLTQGAPALTSVSTTPEFDEPAALRFAAAIERFSEHPIAAAIVAGARSRGIDFPSASGFTAAPGFGAAGIVDGHRVAVGALRYMDQLGVDTTPLGGMAAALAAGGATPLYLAVDGRLAALLTVSDRLKESAGAGIAGLRRLGLRIAMLTGDDRRTAEAVAREAGINVVHAELTPEGKVEVVRQLQAAGRKVAFVGDGINDAPALAQADVGIAIGTGTDVAIGSAELVLMSDDLRKLSTAVALSAATLRNIRQNLFWAFAYNASLIPVAAGALYPAFGVLLSPMLAALAMALSSLCVVANALRLKRFRPPWTTSSSARTSP